MPGTGSFFISERRTYDAYPFSLHSSRFRPRAAPVGAGAAAGLVLFAAAFAALRGLKWNPILVMVLCGVGNLLVGLVLQTIG